MSEIPILEMTRFDAVWGGAEEMRAYHLTGNGDRFFVRFPLLGLAWVLSLHVDPTRQVRVFVYIRDLAEKRIEEQIVGWRELSFLHMRVPHPYGKLLKKLNHGIQSGKEPSQLCARFLLSLARGWLDRNPRDMGNFLLDIAS